MAGVILGTVGAVVGGYFGGPVGAQMGYMAGSMIGNMIDPPKGTHSEGPKLDDLTAQTVSYGTVIGTVYGRYLRAGNVFWAKDKTQHAKTTSAGGGKGGGASNTTTTYTYTQSFAIGLSDREIVGIKKIKANSKVIYSTDDSSSAGSKITSSEISGYFRVYNGTETQLPDPTMESADGVGNVPAYRGTAYIVFTDLLLTDFGNTIPQFQFEVVGKGSGEIKQGTEVINVYSLTGGYITSQLGSNVGSLGEYFRNRFFENNIMFSDTSIFTVQNLPLIKSISTYKAEMYPTQFYANGIRYYGPQASKRDKEDVVFSFDYEIAKIYQYRQKDIAFETYIAPPVFSFNDEKGHSIMAPIGQIENSAYALYANSSMVRTSPFNGASGLNEYRDSTLSIGYMNITAPEMTSFYAIDNLIPAGKFFKGACISQDQNFGFIFYGDTNYQTVSKTYYAKFVLSGNSASIIETGQFEEDIAFCGFGSANIDFGGFLNYDKAYNYCACDNKYLWLIGKDGLTSIFEIDNKILKRKANIGTGSFQYSVNFFAQNGLLYINDNVGSAIFSAIETMEVSKVYLNDIIEDQFSRVGLSEDLYDTSESNTIEVEGYMIGTRSSVRANIETIANAYFFDVHESDGKLKVKMRGRDIVAEITPNEFIIENESSGEARSDFTFKQIQELSVPREIQVNYMNVDSDYAVGVQYARRINTASVDSTTLSIPILLTNDKAKQIAETSLYNVNLERETITFSTNISYYYLEPSDVISVEDYHGQIHTVRIIKKTEGDNGQLQWEAVKDQRSSYIRTDKGATPSDQKPQDVAFIEDVELLPMNLPIIMDSQQDQASYYLAASAKQNGKWKGSVTYKSLDRQTYSMLTEGTFDSSMNTTFGTCINNLQSSNCFDFDNFSKVRVILRNTQAELSSRTYDEILSQKINYALIGEEVVQFAYAELVDEGVYDLYGFIRGMHGTEVHANSHEAGERFILLDMNKINTIPDNLGSIGSLFWLVGLSIGKNNLSQGDEKMFSTNGLTIKPLAPYSFESKLTNGDFLISWYRRARINAGLINNIEVPLDEQTESYIVEIYSDDTYSTLVNDYSVNTTTFTYTTQMQINDLGSAKSAIYAKVYQVSSRIGKGFASIPKLQ